MGAGKTKKIGLIHMSINLVAVAVFALAFVTRLRAADHSGSILFTLVGVALISVSGWLGGEMVYVGGVGVAPAAREAASSRPGAA
jgi:uncharacterized membrane protein